MNFWSQSQKTNKQTIALLALTTTCDGGAFLTTQGTHICLISSFILCGSRVAFINPNIRRDMVPWSIRRVTDPPPNAKLREMQQNMHGLVQLIRAATTNVPNQTPMPQLSKQHGYITPPSWGPKGGEKLVWRHNSGKKCGLGLRIKNAPKRCPVC